MLDTVIYDTAAAAMFKAAKAAESVLNADPYDDSPIDDIIIDGAITGLTAAAGLMRTGDYPQALILQAAAAPLMQAARMIEISAGIPTTEDADAVDSALKGLMQDCLNTLNIDESPAA